MVSLAVGVEIGLLLGVGADVAFLVYRVARPVLTVNKLSVSGNILLVILKISNAVLLPYRPPMAFPIF